MNEDTGFFRSLRGLATDWVQTKRKALQEEPLTDVDSAGGRGAYSFQGQELSFDDLREIKDMRDSGGQVAALMQSKALLHFGEGAEVGVDNNEDTAQEVMGSEMTLEDFIEFAFPDLDLLVLDLGKDALWYPYAVGEIRENRAGQFDEFLPAEPYTLLPETDHKGEIQRWHQRVQTAGGYKRQQLDPTELVHIILNKSSARDTTGISEVLRNKEEIQAFKSNEEAIQQAIELHGFPQRHVQVGREDGAPVRDDELRRVRNIFDPRNTDANTAYFTGQDVAIDTIEAENFDYQAVHEMSTRKLTTALGLPLEAGNVGSDGLGSGKPAELRETMLKLEIKANQRQFATQFVEQVIRPVVRDYSPFDHTRNIDLTINDPLSSQEDVADIINKIGDYLTNAEVRSRLDLPEPDDDEIADGYRTPADIETPEEEQGGGLFGSAAKEAVDNELEGRDTDFRSLETPAGVPDNANPIDSRGECDGQVVKGDRGGLYCVPAGEEPTGGDSETDDVTADPEEIGEFDQQAVEEGDEVIIQDTDGNEHQVSVEVVGSDDAFVVEDSQGNRQVIEPNGESQDGQFEATGIVGGDTPGGGFETSSPVDTPESLKSNDLPVSEGGLRDVPNTDDPQELANSIPTIDKRFGEELEDVPVSPELDLSDEDVDAMRDNMAEMLGNVKDDDLLEQHLSRMSHIHGKTTDRPGSSGHANFGENVPGSGNEMGDIYVENPSISESTVKHEHMHTIHQSLGYSSGGESAGASGGFQTYDSPTSDAEDAKDIQDALVAHENDDAPPLPDDTDAADVMNEVEVNDGTPKTMSTEERVDALDTELEGSGEEKFRQFVAEANKSFLKTQGVKDREGESAAAHMVKKPYQMSNGNEFLAVTNESLQSGDKMAVRKLVEHHPKMVGAYTSVFDVPEETQEVLDFERRKA